MVPFLCYFQKLQLLVLKKLRNNFNCTFLVFAWAQKACLRFLKSYFKLEILIVLSFLVSFLAGGFMELGHVDKLFVEYPRKKVPQGKILELFLLDTLKTTFWMGDSTQGWTQLRPFFPKSGRFSIFIKDRGGLLPPSTTLVAHL